jgi:hypothetical protein
MMSRKLKDPTIRVLKTAIRQARVLHEVGAMTDEALAQSEMTYQAGMEKARLPNRSRSTPEARNALCHPEIPLTPEDAAWLHLKPVGNEIV